MTPTPKVTIFLLTWNRAHLLRHSLASVMAQDYPDYRVVVLDNASTDDTERVVKGFEHPRLTYIRHEMNIGQWRNANFAMDSNTSPYLSLFHDDDAMLPGFIETSVRALDEHPSAAFSFSLVTLIDANGTKQGVQDARLTPEGFIRGHDFLQLVVDQTDCAIQPPSALLRAEALAAMKPVDSPHTRVTADLNLYLRMLTRFDVVFIKRELAQLRAHAGQETESQFAAASAIGWYGSLAERIDAAAHLLRSPHAAEPHYRAWLSERILALHKHESTAVHSFVPSAYHSYDDRRAMVMRDLTRIVARGARCILVDNDELGIGSIHDCSPIPFLEKDGQHWGPPSDHEAAIRELERLRPRVGFIAFAWVAFWWLDRYPGFRDYLRSRFPCVLDNANLVVFDLGLASH